MTHNLQLGDAVLVTPESIELIKKAEQERDLAVHSATYDYSSCPDYCNFTHFCYYKGTDEISPSIGLVKTHKDINILSFEEFEKKVFGNTFTVYVPEGKIPVVSYKTENGIVIDFKQKIDYDKITAGSVVKLKRSGYHCWGDWNENEPVFVVFWNTPHFINSKFGVLRKGYHTSYATFIQDGNIILYNASEEIDFIEEVITY
jgi:hypothetical protein